MRGTCQVPLGRGMPASPPCARVVPRKTVGPDFDLAYPRGCAAPP